MGAKPLEWIDDARSATKGATMSGRRRLTEPLLRGRGGLRPASWDEALDRAATGLRAARDRGGGAHGAGVFSCSKATNEVNFIAQKFARQALGTNDIDSCNRT